MIHSYNFSKFVPKIAIKSRIRSNIMWDSLIDIQEFKIANADCKTKNCTTPCTSWTRPSKRSLNTFFFSTWAFYILVYLWTACSVYLKCCSIKKKHEIGVHVSVLCELNTDDVTFVSGENLLSSFFLLPKKCRYGLCNFQMTYIFKMLKGLFKKFQ